MSKIYTQGDINFAELADNAVNQVLADNQTIQKVLDNLQPRIKAVTDAIPGFEDLPAEHQNRIRRATAKSFGYCIDPVRFETEPVKEVLDLLDDLGEKLKVACEPETEKQPADLDNKEIAILRQLVHKAKRNDAATKQRKANWDKEIAETARRIKLSTAQVKKIVQSSVRTAETCPDKNDAVISRLKELWAHKARRGSYMAGIAVTEIYGNYVFAQTSMVGGDVIRAFYDIRERVGHEYTSEPGFIIVFANEMIGNPKIDINSITDWIRKGKMHVICADAAAKKYLTGVSRRGSQHDIENAMEYAAHVGTVPETN